MRGCCLPWLLVDGSYGEPQHVSDSLVHGSTELQQQNSNTEGVCEICGHELTRHEESGLCTVMINEGTGVPVRCGCERDRVV